MSINASVHPIDLTPQSSSITISSIVLSSSTVVGGVHWGLNNGKPAFFVLPLLRLTLLPQGETTSTSQPQAQRVQSLPLEH